MTTTVRSVRVELELKIDQYVANARTAGRETDAAFDRVEAKVVATDRAMGGLDKSTAELSKTSAQARTSQAGLGREIDKTEVSAKKAERSIDKYSGRLGLILKAGAAIVPAFVPIGAVAIPAVAGLVSQLGFAAGAAGTAVLAFQGVGDSLKAIEKARLEPTVENLKAADEAVRRLAPEAQDLVHHLEDLAGAGRGLQRTAAGGFLPGVDDALTSLEDRIPDIRRLIKEVSDAAGDEVRDAGESLASSRWDAFFEYLRTQARPQLSALADSVGNLVHGFAQLAVATTPLQSDFTGFLVRATETFDEWATRLGSSTEFQQFVAYVRENGPQVEATAEAIASAILQIVEAAAPLGGPTLQILETVADILGTIADSDVGTPLLTLLSLTSAYSLVAGRVKAVNETAWGGKQVSNLKAFGATLSTVVTAQDRAQLSATRLAKVEEHRSAAIRGGLSTLGKGAALAGLFGIAASGVASKVGLANTATLALAGSMAGPWGAAVGAGVGLLLDWSHRSDAAKESTAEFTATLDQQTGSLTENSRALAVQKLDQAGALDAAKELGLSLSLVTDAALGNEQAQSQLNAALAGYEQVISGTTSGRGAAVTGYNAEAAAVDKVGSTVAQVAGIVGDSLAAFDTQSEAMGGTTRQTNALRTAYDQAAGAAENLTAELSELDDFLNNRGSFRAYQASLDALRDSLKDAPHAFSALGEAGRTNLGNLDQIVSDAARHLETLTSPKQKANFLDSVIKTLKQIGQTSPEAAAAVRDVLPALREVRDANDVGAIKLDNADAMKKALITKLALKDLHSERPTPVIDANDSPFQQTYGTVKQSMAQADRLRAKPTIAVDPGNSLSIIGSVLRLLGQVKSKAVTITTNHVDAHSPSSGGPLDLGTPKKPKADGGTIEGARTPYGDKVLIHAAPGEEIISNRHGQADRFRADRAAGRIPAYADGGTVADSTHTTRIGPNSQLYGIGQAWLSIAELGDRIAHLTTKQLKSLGDDMDQLSKKNLKGLATALDKAAAKVEKSYDKQKSILDDLISQRDSSASSIASSAIHDPFGNGLAGLDAQTEADSADLTAMSQALATLVANGLSPKSALYQQLAAHMDVNTAQQLAQLSAGDLASRAQRFEALQGQAAAFGQGVAGEQFNEAIRDQTKATNRLEHRLEELQHAIHDLKDLPKHVKDGAYQGTVVGANEGSYHGTKDGQDEKRQRTRAMVRTGSK